MDFAPPGRLPLFSRNDDVLGTFALYSTRIKVNAACPGFTATDLNNFHGTRTVPAGRT
jgi:hypothetical protein